MASSWPAGWSVREYFVARKKNNQGAPLEKVKSPEKVKSLKDSAMAKVMQSNRFNALPQQNA